MTAVSAWRDPEAMRRSFHEGLAKGGHTAVYLPLRQGKHWCRRGVCGTMARLDRPQGAGSACGAELEVPA